MTMSNFVISTRNVIVEGRKARFGNEPNSETLYLIVPNGKVPHPVKHVKSRKAWLKALLERAKTGCRPVSVKDKKSGFTMGDVLIFIHGYNNSMKDVMNRHDLLQEKLGGLGYQGAIVSFDWPSAELTLGYLEDRDDAYATARQLVSDGISVISAFQREQEKNECDIDIHLLCHSTGAYVAREAFYLSEKSASINRVNWNVSQVVFIGGDVSRKALSASNCKSQSLFRHSTRITNYENPYDSALKASNIKRLGFAPRAGRVGVPDDCPDHVVNVSVGDYWQKNVEGNAKFEVIGNRSHSWHFADDIFATDLLYTLRGDIDRHRIPTREKYAGELRLKPVLTRAL